MPRIRVKGTPGGEYAIIAKHGRFAGTESAFINVLHNHVDPTVTGIDMDAQAIFNLRTELDGKP